MRSGAAASVTTGTAPASSPVVSRTNVRFSVGGHYAACVAGDDHGYAFGEVWSLAAAEPRRVVRVPIRSDSAMTLVLPQDDGRTLVAVHRPGTQRFDLLDRAGRSRCLGEYPPGNMRLITAPGRCGALALGVATGVDGHSTVYRIDQATPAVRQVAQVAGPLSGPGVAVGEGVLLTLHTGDGPVPVLVDTASGQVTRVPSPDACRTWYPVVGCARSLLVAADTTDGHRLGVVPTTELGELRLLPAADLGGAVAPFALRPDGTTAALTVARGARSWLALLDTATGAARRVPLPPGVVGPTGSWTAGRLWFTASTPTRPTRLCSLSAEELPADAPPTAGEADRAAPAGRWAPGRLEVLDGPDGPIEAVVYGGDWRNSARVVVALHGGPRDRWTLAFNRSFQTLVEAGVTVVAPNQRGSTGYGAAHERAIVGAWGGPDLADILAIGHAIRARRGAGHARPALFGVSYGAHLAMVCSFVEADLWSRCAVAAPFLSADRLYPEAEPAVRTMIDRTRGRERPADGLGCHDLVRLARRSAIRYLIVHGALDETIPVGHSRALVAALGDVGYAVSTDADRVADVCYLELPGRGHRAVGENAADPAMTAVARFLSDSTDEGR